MNIEQFRGTRKAVTDLSKELPSYCTDNVEPGTPGLVYEGDLFIEGPDAKGHYYLCIGNFQMYTESCSLEDMEAELFDFGNGEGMFE